MTKTPINTPLPDGANNGLLVELKLQLVVFLREPPGPRMARRMFEIYEPLFGDTFGIYKPTLDYAQLSDWDQTARNRYEHNELPMLRHHHIWGYGFQESKSRDARLFMYHGYRPHQECVMASFCRFEFEADLPPAKLLQFAEGLLAELPVLSAYGGFFFQGRPSDQYDARSADRIYALSRRFWGVDVSDVELTAEVMKTGYRSVNWLTAISHVVDPELQLALNQARNVAYRATTLSTCTLFQASEGPIVGDRNRANDDLSGYMLLAEALSPLQILTHSAFRGERWNDQNTMAWLRRFTHPEDL